MMEIGETEKKKSMDLLEEWIKMIENSILDNSLLTHRQTITSLIIYYVYVIIIIIIIIMFKMNMQNKSVNN